MTHDEAARDWSRRLARAWAWLAGLTGLSLVAVLGFGQVEAGAAAAAVALAASYFKARLVLHHFLDLRRADAGWRGFFAAMLAAILGGLMVAYLIPAF
ncbi:cytochrome C oxidase subunit IV family protein [Magnetospirillum sp. UT-4]|uniref:cytochrome C oxidase subunit IV family protein n=1 Tax=Magnetospirillum sp. UT-4 TaxID=2681467 RepID=UPI001383942F|nr:cytochrome C oxidase subunit IV family protein [Magnetospirillum sp. UT-4]CAA7615197.1 Membrane protein [Magnetospirillum sp. UT-4]